MKVLTPFFTVVAVPLLAVAHGGENLHYARQASTGATSHSGSTNPSSTSGTVPSNVPVTSSGASVATSSGASGATPTTSSTSSILITLLSTNPTAVPLASIVSNEPSLPTQPPSTTEVSGAVPSGIPNAPPLPNSTFYMLRSLFFPLLRSAASISQFFLIVANWNPANYPPLDRPPPTDSPQALQWIQNVKLSGVQIPDFAPTNPGSCRAIFRLTAVDRRSRWMS